MKKELGEAQREFRDKINKLIEKEDKIDKLIEEFEKRWQALLRMRNDNKDETVKILNDHSERIEQSTEGVDALFVEPLAHWRPPQSLESLNTSGQRHQEAPEIIFLGNMHNSRFQDKDYQNF